MKSKTPAVRATRSQGTTGFTTGNFLDSVNFEVSVPVVSKLTSLTFARKRDMRRYAIGGACTKSRKEEGREDRRKRTKRNVIYIEYTGHADTYTLQGGLFSLLSPPIPYISHLSPSSHLSSLFFSPFSSFYPVCDPHGKH